MGVIEVKLTADGLLAIHLACSAPFPFTLNRPIVGVRISCGLGSNDVTRANNSPTRNDRPGSDLATESQDTVCDGDIVPKFNVIPDIAPGNCTVPANIHLLPDN
jgi:hypothetical protein